MKYFDYHQPHIDGSEPDEPGLVSDEIAAELCAAGLRLADDDEPGAWLWFAGDGSEHLVIDDDEEEIALADELAAVAAEIELGPTLPAGARFLVTGGAYRGQRGTVHRPPTATFAMYTVLIDGAVADEWGLFCYILPGDLAAEPTPPEPDYPDCRNDGEPGIYAWVPAPTPPTSDDAPELTSLMALAEAGALDDAQGDALAELIAADVAKPKRKRDPRTTEERALDRAHLRLSEGAAVIPSGGAWLVASNSRAGVVHRVEGGVCSCEALGVCWHLKVVEITEARIDDEAEYRHLTQSGAQWAA